jgi:hypothetical protein
VLHQILAALGPLCDLPLVLLHIGLESLPLYLRWWPLCWHLHVYKLLSKQRHRSSPALRDSYGSWILCNTINRGRKDGASWYGAFLSCLTKWSCCAAV